MWKNVDFRINFSGFSWCSGWIFSEAEKGVTGVRLAEAPGICGPQPAPSIKDIRSGPLGARGVLNFGVFSLCMLLSELLSARSSPNSCGFSSEALCVLLTCMCFPGLMKPRELKLEITILVLFSASIFKFLLMDFGICFGYLFMMFLWFFITFSKPFFGWFFKFSESIFFEPREPWNYQKSIGFSYVILH